MLVLRDRLIDVPIMSLQTGARIGTMTQAIIDPRKLNIVAFYCEGPRIDFKPAILHTVDIREISSLGMIVDSANNIMSPDDLVRLQEIINFNFVLENKKVVDDKGSKLGKVINYTVDTRDFYVAKIHVKPSLLQSFSSAEFLIDRSQIKSIDDKKIIVKSATIKGRAKEARDDKKPIVENPFRKAKPQQTATEHQEE